MEEAIKKQANEAQDKKEKLARELQIQSEQESVFSSFKKIETCVLRPHPQEAAKSPKIDLKQKRLQPDN